jgi:dienelactone hydrolase
MKAACSIIGLFLTAALFAGPPDAADPPGQSNRLPHSPLFLDVFRTPGEPIVVEPFELDSATGERGSLYRPKSDEQLPGLLLTADGATPEFFAQTARELAGIGYAVLIVPAVKVDGVAARIERATALVRKAARRLKHRKDIFAEKIGVLGWGPTAICALNAAGAESAQAAVLVDLEASVTTDDRLAAALPRMAVLIIQADVRTRDRLRQRLASTRVELNEFRLSGAKPGFMDCRSGEAFDGKAADRTWFEIYEFLGKYVEDAGLKPPLTVRSTPSDQSRQQFASIGDAMRKANGATGARTAVARALNEGPRDDRDWKLLREQSHVLIDCGQWLLDQTPRKGSSSSWRRDAVAYRDAAQALVGAAERSDRNAAQSALNRLNSSCARCHAEHR